MSNDATNGYAEVNGLRMYYEVHGIGRPLVLLHGAFVPSRAAPPGCRRSQGGFPSVELREEHRAGLPNAFVRLERATEE